MKRNLLILVVVAVVGVALHVLLRPVTEVNNVLDVGTKDGEIRMRHPSTIDSHKIRRHLAIILEVICA